MCAESVKFFSLHNLPFGPYRSGSWGRQKQDRLQRMTSMGLDAQSKDASFALREQWRIEQHESAYDAEAMSRRFGKNLSCNTSGPVAKYSR